MWVIKWRCSGCLDIFILELKKSLFLALGIITFQLIPGALGVNEDHQEEEDKVMRWNPRKRPHLRSRQREVTRE